MDRSIAHQRMAELPKRIDSATTEFPDWVVDHFPLMSRIQTDGTCAVSGRYQRGRIVAHAHGWANNNDFATDTHNMGTVCFFGDGSWDAGYPTPTFLHEYAHLLVGRKCGLYRNTSHGKDWKDAFRTLLLDWGYTPPTKITGTNTHTIDRMS